jgi:hypothetical protein
VKVGDLITTSWEGGNQVYWETGEEDLWWPAFRFEKGQVGVILELYGFVKRSGVRRRPAAKVLVDGQVGWIDLAFFEPVIDKERSE